MDEVTLLPTRTKSKRTRSSNTSRENHQRDRNSKAPATSSNSAARSARPNLASRTSSAPLVPLSKDPNLLNVEDDFDPHSHRDSVASIKDDPFFRNYQSPHSVSLARELRSATYSERLHDEDNPSPKSGRRPPDNSVNLPVCNIPQQR
jgi:hypothetical protein